MVYAPVPPRCCRSCAQKCVFATHSCGKNKDMEVGITGVEECRDPRGALAPAAGRLRAKDCAVWPRWVGCVAALTAALGGNWQRKRRWRGPSACCSFSAAHKTPFISAWLEDSRCASWLRGPRSGQEIDSAYLPEERGFGRVQCDGGHRGPPRAERHAHGVRCVQCFWL